MPVRPAGGEENEPGSRLKRSSTGARKVVIPSRTTMVEKRRA